MKPKEVRVAVLHVEGTNCEEETVGAFRALGADAERIHLNQLVREVSMEWRRSLDDYHVLVFPGGFSSGDYVRAGAIWAARAKSRLLGEMEAFIEAGKPVVGICNGFQVLVEMGFLPGPEVPEEGPQAVLATNDSAHYECRPTLLRYENRGHCAPLARFARGQVMLAPSAHTEGKLTLPQNRQAELLARLEAEDQVLFRYVDPSGTSGGYPWNPNGSVDDIAGLCSPEGTVLGLMPHPERSFYRHLHPDWTRDEATSAGDGRLFFESLVEYVTRRF